MGKRPGNPVTIRAIIGRWRYRPRHSRPSVREAAISISQSAALIALTTQNQE